MYWLLQYSKSPLTLLLYCFSHCGCIVKQKCHCVFFSPPLVLSGFVLPLGNHDRWSDLPGQALAPRVFPMHRLQKAAVGSALYLQGKLPLLPWMLQRPVCKEVCGMHQAHHQWVTGRARVFIHFDILHAVLQLIFSAFICICVWELSNKHAEGALICKICKYVDLCLDVCRSGRGQVHLFWGAPVAQRVLHLHAVLRVTGGTRLPHPAWQHLVHWLWQGEVTFPWKGHCYNKSSNCASMNISS